MKPNSRPRRRRPAPKPQGQRMVILLLLAAVMLAAVYMAASGPAGQRKMEANPYGPGDFATVNGYLTCLTGKTRRGIDVSEFQGDIDWAQVYGAGFDFAFVRLGNRGYKTGEIKADERWAENLDGAKAAGLQVGAYFYSQATSTAEALEEAGWCLKLLGSRALDLPLVFDWEWVSHDARTGSMDKETVTACARVFCDAVAKGGYQGMIYFNPHISRDLMDLKELEGYPWWLAQYREQMDFPHRVEFWQYTETGRVPGIQGNVDIDLMFLD